MVDTIYALATAPGRAGLAVVRVSGPRAAEVLRSLTGRVPEGPRRVGLCRIFDCDNETIDECLVIWFEKPSSFTGEDVVEFHLHGGHAILARLFESLAAMEGVRLAVRGEFTRRAVENGKLDLTRAEAIADLVDAETEAQRIQAFRQYSGSLFERTRDWQARLTKALAWHEAAIDFAEDEVPLETAATSARAVSEILEEMQRLARDSRRGEMIREGVQVAIVGPPNAGKSSLINALAGRDVAIVSDIPGTTRDVIEVRLDLGGYPVIVADTAGLREAGGAIEAEGVRRARARAEAADLVVLLLDGSAAEPLAGLEPQLIESADLVLWNKLDLLATPRGGGVWLSLKTGQGLDRLVEILREMVAEQVGAGSGNVVLTRARHREAVEDAILALGRSRQVPDAELVAEDLRLAVRAIGRLTGRVDVEELLDRIFRDFCIGK